ncbi:hypothetical protein [Streptomyces viridosporus]|uniref:Uncharacterized protein n=1 Tax=Streptomyces viridosporus T7A TaxID=665577 RepID=A0ABX6AP83_STRVD|nr:hypothetical protein [Streptomyces viridosporus]QEU88981.1 hypothetical protein CP969_33065 [Streptomyces viridosporus T7A]
MQVAQADSDVPVSALRPVIDRAAVFDNELQLDPDYFAAWARRDPRVGFADVRVKRGAYHNELSRYRYDAVLHTRAVEPAVNRGAWSGARTSRTWTPPARC